MTHRPGAPPLAQAPRPFADETISSWLLRVAAANGATLEDLITHLRRLHRGAFAGVDLFDYGLPEREVLVLAETCRVARATIRQLDLRVRLPHLHPELVARFSGPDDRRCRRHRARYSYCPLCLQRDFVPYTRWQWCLVAVTHCPLHGVPLHKHRSLSCCENDPIDLDPSAPQGHLRCRGCGDLLTRHGPPGHFPFAPPLARAMVQAYLEAHRDCAPSRVLAGKMTAREFRAFVDDMVIVFAQSRQQATCEPQIGAASGPDFTVILYWALVYTAPERRLAQRRTRRQLSAKVWRTTLDAFCAFDLEAIQHRSLAWSPRLRRIANAFLEEPLARQRRYQDSSRSRSWTTQKLEEIGYFLEQPQNAGA